MSNPPEDHPPRRRWLRWLIGFGFLPAGIVAFYLIENFRGDRAWAAAKSDLAAAGISLNFNDYLPDPSAIPDEENVAAAEPYATLCDGHASERRSPFSESVAVTIRLAPASFSSGAPPQFAAASSPAIPDTSSPAAAQDLLNLLSVHEETLTQIRAACARPHVRFPVKLDEHGMPNLPQLRLVGDTSSILKNRASALIAVGRSSEALADLNLMLRQADLVKSPTLIAQLIQQTTISMAVAPVWYGLGRDAWTDADLRDLQQRWAGIGFNDHLPQVIRAEHALMQGTLEKMAQNRRQASRDLEIMTSLVAGNVFDSTSDLGQFRTRAFVSLFPTGWLRQNQAWFATNTLSMLAELEERPGGTDALILFGESPTLTSTVEQKTTPHNFIARLFWPVMGTMNKNRRQLAADIALLRTAIAIEQHRRATGSLPAALPELATPPPVDPITGDPLHYQRLDDRRYKLWSVALNETDEGGNNEDHRTSSPDWVWRSWIEPPKPAPRSGAKKKSIPKRALVPSLPGSLPPPP